jgi:hypothetical protein
MGWWGGGVGQASHIKRPNPRGKHIETYLLGLETDASRYRKFLTPFLGPAFTMSPQSFLENANCVYGEEGEGGGEEEHRTNLSWCSICGCCFCESCWDKERAHRPRKNSTVAAIHQKTNVRIARLVDSILHPRADIENSKKRHRENRATKWIGVSNDEHGTPTMKDFRRFEDLAFDQENPSGEQFPSLVTFVGSTGAGKSTLINALIKVCHICAMFNCVLL